MQTFFFTSIVCLLPFGSYTSYPKTRFRPSDPDTMAIADLHAVASSSAKSPFIMATTSEAM